MKLRLLSAEEVSVLVEELRTMSMWPAGTNVAALDRAKEIRFQLQGQKGVTPTAVAKADEVYRQFEILFHAHRWREHEPLDALRKVLKSSCDRLRAHMGVGSSTICLTSAEAGERSLMNCVACGAAFY